MAKVNNVGLNLTRKIANPFKTSRAGVTNPFKYQDFEGNTLNLDPLAFADVLSASKSKTNKLRMITSSVAGSMTKFRTGITESITAFVHRVEGIWNQAWDYAKNKEITKFGSYKPIIDIMNTDIVEIGKGIGNSISGIGKGIADKVHTVNADIIEKGKGMSEKWSALIKNIKPSHGSRIPKNASVCEYKQLWLNEIELEKSIEEGRMVA